MGLGWDSHAKSRFQISYGQNLDNKGLTRRADLADPLESISWLWPLLAKSRFQRA